MSRKSKYWFKNSAYLGLSILFVFVVLGCASTRKTTKTETVVTQSNAAPNPEGQNTASTVSTSTDKQTTTSTTTENKGGHPGIISSTVHAIGWVIALPFRLIGGLIEWIF
jgi:hypothetical protein